MESDPLNIIWLGSIPYREAHEVQRRIHGEVAAGRRGHTLLALEHPPVYTLGKRGGREHLHVPDDALEALGVEVVETDRGGLITFHGPGQLVAYPIINLARMKRSLGWYIEHLLDATTAAAVAMGATEATVDPDRPGVWVGARKLASVGVRYTEGATLHGVALNLSVDLAWFRRMSPCGLSIEATSIQEIVGSAPDSEQAGIRLHEELSAALGLPRGRADQRERS